MTPPPNPIRQISEHWLALGAIACALIQIGGLRSDLAACQSDIAAIHQMHIEAISQKVDQTSCDVAYIRQRLDTERGK